MAGFTLLELLAVVTLLAILATGALVAYDGTDEQARIDVTKMEMAELRNALLQFRRDTGAFPCGVYHEPNLDGSTDEEPKLLEHALATCHHRGMPAFA